MVSRTVVEQVASGPELAVVAATHPGWSPAALFDCWVRPVLLRMWWPPEAAIEPRVGGSYRLEWPLQQWTLRGVYVAFDPGRELAFTWRWDHDAADVPETLVRVAFDATQDAAGTRLRVQQGVYPDTTRGREWRQGHLEGWLHFLTKLGEVPRPE